MDDKNTPLGVGRRDYKDRKPGKPVPFHEPDPNRFAISDEIKARLAREAEEKLQRSAVYLRQQNHRYEKKGKPAVVAKPRPTLAETIAKTDIPFPPHPERAVPKEAGELRASRDGKVLYFTSATEAAAAFNSKSLSPEDKYSNEIRYSTILRAYLRDGDGVAVVFGWKFERLVTGRPARTRLRDKRK